MTGANTELGHYDARSVANAVLIECRRNKKAITNLALQKLVYFAHGLFLVRNKTPLVSGYFEAWHHGPVHPAVYMSFKDGGRESLKHLAKRKDLRTGELSTISPPRNDEVRRIITTTVLSYGNLTAGQLVRLSHAKGGPWDVVFQKSKLDNLVGLRISNELILERFQYHKASACQLEDVREPDEDSPLTNYGFG